MAVFNAWRGGRRGGVFRKLNSGRYEARYRFEGISCRDCGASPAHEVAETHTPGVLVLMISLNTLRTHTKNIYTEARRGDRRAAVRRAEELGL